MSLKTIVDGAAGAIASAMKDATPAGADLRRPVLESIDLAERQWASSDQQAPASWFSESDGTVAFSPGLANGAPLTIDGQTTVFVPADRFADYLQAMRSAVEQGEFDAEIRGAAGGSPNVSGLARVAMPAPGKGSAEDIRAAQREEWRERQRHAPADDT